MEFSLLKSFREMRSISINANLPPTPDALIIHNFLAYVFGFVPTDSEETA